METLADSSVLVAFFNEKDALHARALAELRAVTGAIVVHEYVVLETATVLVVRAGKAAADQFVRTILGNAAFVTLMSSESAFLTTTDAFLNGSAKLAFTDAALLALAGEYRVLTFDKALAKAIVTRKQLLP